MVIVSRSEKLGVSDVGSDVGSGAAAAESSAVCWAWCAEVDAGVVEACRMAAMAGMATGIDLVHGVDVRIIEGL